MKHDTIALQGSIADMRTRIASEQGAMHKVKLGVARWRSPLAALEQEESTADDASSPASQVRWHAEAQCHFMCWLEQGGFAQEEAQADNLVASAATAQGQQETPKEVLAQAEQSATPISPVHSNDCTT
ncbi:hypothetical protein [Janthinobacterium sp. HLX7-2]|uniref:hypothetical protein n=1 Tax=Janthinobacterium sp. HLX7-2 TaxID=1259331 RepID=UPI003F275619